MHSRKIYLLYFSIVVAILASIAYLALSDEVIYIGTVKDIESQVYDGDTIKDILVKVATHKTPDGEVWPGVFIQDGDVYVSFDLRINGIDTPEKRPRRAGRTEQSRINEKYAASLARQAVVDLLVEADGQLELHNPETGKYAGRMLGDMYVQDEQEDLIYVADYLIQRGHALPYDGGTKAKPDWDALDQGYMVPLDDIEIPPQE